MYFSHNSNINHVDSIIKYIGFGLIHYVIHLNIILLFIVISDIDFIYIMYC